MARRIPNHTGACDRPPPLDPAESARSNEEVPVKRIEINATPSGVCRPGPVNLCMGSSASPFWPAPLALTGGTRSADNGQPAYRSGVPQQELAQVAVQGVEVTRAGHEPDVSVGPDEHHSPVAAEGTTGLPVGGYGRDHAGRNAEPRCRLPRSGRRLPALAAWPQDEGPALVETSTAFFLFVLTAGAVPFALAPLTGRLTGADPLSEDGARRHADRVVSTLFGEGSSGHPGA